MAEDSNVVPPKSETNKVVEFPLGLYIFPRRMDGVQIIYIFRAEYRQTSGTEYLKAWSGIVYDYYVVGSCSWPQYFNCENTSFAESLIPLQSDALLKIAREEMYRVASKHIDMAQPYHEIMHHLKMLNFKPAPPPEKPVKT